MALHNDLDHCTKFCNYYSYRYRLVCEGFYPIDQDEERRIEMRNGKNLLENEQ